MEEYKMFTPQQVAEMLQVKVSTVYELINRGEIPAKRLGRVFRISKASVPFIFTGMDYDIEQAQNEDLKNIKEINLAINAERKKQKK